jgi:hypothetical protein
MDVLFEDFLKSEGEVVRKISLAFNLTLDINDREIHVEGDRYMSKHRYNLDDWNIDIDELYMRFDFYHKTIFGQDAYGKSRKLR